MIEISRDEFKSDPVWSMLYKVIVSNHKPADHTVKTLMENRHIKDFCEEARHFMVIDVFFVHYDVATWIVEDHMPTKIERIGIYDTYMEYEQARLNGIHSTPDSDGKNLN